MKFNSSCVLDSHEYWKQMTMFKKKQIKTYRVVFLCIVGSGAGSCFYPRVSKLVSVVFKQNSIQCKV